jgi:hypothetical protein
MLLFVPFYMHLKQIEREKNRRGETIRLNERVQSMSLESYQYIFFFLQNRKHDIFLVAVEAGCYLDMCDVLMRPIFTITIRQNLSHGMKNFFLFD